MKPADIRLLALDYEPVWLSRFCGQRHFTPANDTGDHFAKPLPTPSGAPCPGLTLLCASAGVTVGAADAGEGRGTSHDASISRGGQDNHA